MASLSLPGIEAAFIISLKSDAVCSSDVSNRSDATSSNESTTSVRNAVISDSVSVLSEIMSRAILRRASNFVCVGLMSPLSLGKGSDRAKPGLRILLVLGSSEKNERWKSSAMIFYTIFDVLLNS